MTKKNFIIKTAVLLHIISLLILLALTSGIGYFFLNSIITKLTQSTRNQLLLGQIRQTSISLETALDKYIETIIFFDQINNPIFVISNTTTIADKDSILKSKPFGRLAIKKVISLNTKETDNNKKQYLVFIVNVLPIFNTAIIFWFIFIFLSIPIFYRFKIKLEKQQLYNEKIQKLTAIGSLTSFIAHDVRKPFCQLLTILKMFDVLRNNPSELEKAKVEIEKSTKNVEKMLSDIMDFSREVKLDVKEESIINIFDFSSREASRENVDLDITFNWNFNHRFKPLIDAERFTRVLTNIYSNAIEAITIIGRKVTGTIETSTLTIEKNGKNYLQIIIFNNGPIFNEKDLPYLFETFFTKGKKKGTGLGLASCKKIVTLHNGEIEARNREDASGVEFVIDLPSSSEPEEINSSKLLTDLKNLHSA